MSAGQLTRQELRDSAENLLAVAALVHHEGRRTLGVIARDAVRVHQVLTLEEAAQLVAWTPQSLELLMDEVTV